jgi:hypothetical protein
MGNIRKVTPNFIKECQKLLAKGYSIPSVAKELGVSSSTLYTLAKADFNIEAYDYYVKEQKTNFDDKTSSSKTVPMPNVLTTFAHITLFSRTDYVVMTDGVVLKCKNGNIVSIIDNKGVLKTQEV